MVEFVSDPENPYNLIPRFNDPQEMGDFYEEKQYKGKCVAATETLVPKDIKRGETYEYGYTYESPLAPAILALLIFAAKILFIAFLVVIIAAAIVWVLGGVVGVLSAGEAEAEKIGDDTVLVRCKDGTTHTIQASTGKIISGDPCGKAPISTITDWVTPVVILVGVCVGGYVVYRLVKSGTAQRMWQKTKSVGHKVVG